MEKNSLEQNIFRFIPFCKKRNLRLSVVIKMPENNRFQAFGNFETIGSKFRYGISKKVATVRNHLRKGLKILFSTTKSVWFPKRILCFILKLLLQGQSSQVWQNHFLRLLASRCSHARLVLVGSH